MRLMLYLLLIMAMMVSCSGRVDEKSEEAFLSSDYSSVSSSGSSTLSSSVISELNTNLSSSSSARQFKNNPAAKRTGSKTLSNSLTSTQITLIVSAATTTVSTAGLSSSENLIELMPKIIEGSQGQLSTVFTDSTETIKVINVIVNSMVKSLNGRSSYLPSSSAETGTSATETVLNKITGTSVANLDEAGLEFLCYRNCLQ